MTKTQRYKYETLVRVRDYGMTHRDAFPESSPGGKRFTQVTKAVEAIDRHLRNRALGAADARKVKATTRAAVVDYMKTIAQAARRVTRTEGGQSPFRLPRRRSLKADLSAAELFIEEAAKRQDHFVQLGMPPTFISEFTALVNTLQKAVDARLSSKTVRGEASSGLAVELRKGFELVRDLDVAVTVAARVDPTLAGAWTAARRVEGQTRRSSSDAPTAVPLALVPVHAAVEAVGRSS